MHQLWCDDKQEGAIVVKVFFLIANFTLICFKVTFVKCL